MAELTVGTAFFLLFVLFPGYVSLWASGRVADVPEALRAALYRGVFIFASVLLFCALVELVAKEVGYICPLATTMVHLLSGGRGMAPGLIVFWAVGFLILFYTAAVLAGFLGLWLDLRAVRLLKTQVWLRNLLVRKTPFEVSSREDALFYVFLYYRLAGKRPYVALGVEGEDRGVRGEVIKVAWGPRGGVMVLDADDPRSAVWVPLAQISSVRFENTVASDDWTTLPEWLRKWLELVHPGLAGEVEAKLAEKRKQKN